MDGNEGKWGDGAIVRQRIEGTGNNILTDWDRPNRQ